MTGEKRSGIYYYGATPQQIINTLGTRQAVIYKDINFLTDLSKRFMYSMAKGTHVLMYKKAIDGLKEAGINF